MRVTGKPHVDSSKKDRVRGKTFAEGGNDRMLRTVPAERAPAGKTGPARLSPQVQKPPVAGLGGPRAGYPSRRLAAIPPRSRLR
jgi:hypothetical protein